MKLLLCAFFCPLQLELLAQGGDVPETIEELNVTLCGKVSKSSLVNTEMDKKRMEIDLMVELTLVHWGSLVCSSSPRKLFDIETYFDVVLIVVMVLGIVLDKDEI